MYLYWNWVLKVICSKIAVKPHIHWIKKYDNQPFTDKTDKKIQNQHLYHILLLTIDQLYALSPS